MTSMARVPWQLWFVLLGAIWGCSFLLIKLGLASFTPVQVAFWRLAIGAGTLLVIAAASRTALPRRWATWRHLAVVALLFCSIPFTLFAFGETLVSSVLAGLINSMTPLMTLAVVLAAFPEERPTRERKIGLLVGFTGALVVIGIWKGIGGDLLGVLACVGAITCYGIAYPYTRRHLTGTGDGPVAIATGQVLLGALFLLPVVGLLSLGGAVAGVPDTPITGTSVAAMVVLGALGSGVAYVLSMRIVMVAGATTASSVTYITPVFAVVAGFLFLGEPVSWNEPVGGAIVLLGVAIAQGRMRLQHALRGEEPAAG